MNEGLNFLMVNLEFIGTEFSKLSEGEIRRDKFTVKIKDYTIIFKQLKNYDDIIKKLNRDEYNSGGATYEAIVETSLDNYEEVKKIIGNLCLLLSFAKGIFIFYSKITRIKNRKVEYFEISNVGRRTFKRKWSVIPEHPPELLPKFLEDTYSNFEKYKESFKLTNLINLYTYTKSAFFFEMKAISGYILLEVLGYSLREYYEKKGEPIKNNLEWTEKSFRKILPKDHNLSDESIQKIIKKINPSHPSRNLKDVVNRIIRDFKFKLDKDDEKIFEYRKYFIHEGRYPPKENSVIVYNKIINFIDRIILSILGYKGEYSNIIERGKIKNMEYKD